MILLLLLFALATASLPTPEKIKWISPSQPVGLTPKEVEFLLQVHNVYRAAIASKSGVFASSDKPQAADMRLLVWNEETARRAQEWANECRGPMHNKNKVNEGQNYAGYGTSKDSFREAFKHWAEKEEPLWQWAHKVDDSYTYLESGAGHFTQIVWSKTMEVGCGFNSCPNHFSRLVCNFRYGGNYPYVLPYTPGAPCSRCDPGFGFCVDGTLCARSCPEGAKCSCSVDADRCSRHGEFDRASCSCRCRPGWMGLNCDEPCRNPDGDKWCFDAAHCKEGSEYFVQFQYRCPLTCGRCKKGEAEGNTTRQPVPSGDRTETEKETRKTTTDEESQILTSSRPTSAGLPEEEKPIARREEKEQPSRKTDLSVRIEGECDDKFDCEYYVRAGSCGHTSWSTKYCPFSCGFCVGRPAPIFPDLGCKDWYSRADCDWYIHSTGWYSLCHNLAWANGVCRFSCGKC